MLQPLCPATLDYPIEQQPLHPLHVAVTVKDLEDCPDISISLKHEGHFTAALMKDAHSYSKSIFINVHVLNVDVPDGDEDILHIYVTREFLKHYRFTFMQKVYLKPVQCIPLSKVVFGARTEASYLWAKGETWHDDLLLATCQKKSLCRLHDVLLLSPIHFMLEESSLHSDMFVIACEPVNQGLITTDTTVIILDVGDKLVRKALHSDFKFCMTADSSLLSQLYLNHWSYDHLRISSQVAPPNIHLSGIPDEYVSFRIQIIPRFNEVFNVEQVESNVLDPLNTVFLTRGVLDKMGVLPGSYVKAQLILYGQEENYGHLSSLDIGTEKLRLITVCPIDETTGVTITDPLVAYVTPHLWFNLNTHPSKLLQPDCRLLITPFRPKTTTTPPIAKEIFISLVQSPCYDGTIKCDAMVKRYFSEPRYVCKGDIIGISTRDAVDFHQRSREGDSVIAQPIVYFRISMIEGNPSESGYLVYGDYTKMYQAGTAQHYIPVAMESFYSFEPNPSFVDSPTPPGLTCYVDLLEEIIEPIVTIQNNCSFSVNSNVLLTGAAGCGKSIAVRAICRRLNLHLYNVNCHELLGENSATIEARLKTIIDRASMYAPCVMMLKNIDCLGKEKELKGENSRVLSTLCDMLRTVNNPDDEWPVIVIATSASSNLMSGDMSSAFLHVVNIEPHGESERFEILESLLRPYLINFDVSPAYLSQRTAGFVLADLCTLVSEATKNCHTRLRSLLKQTESLKLEEDVNLAGFPVTRRDFLNALDKLQADYAESSGAPKIPDIAWEDVGGLANVKQDILDTIQLPMDHPEIVAAGLRRSGVLLYGPPGTGKTLIAKAVATECSLNFMSIKGPELINMYVGQSEENVRAVFEQAHAAAPCIIFFDELDSLAPNRGRSGDSGGVMDRVVSQLLSEIDGLDSSSEVFVIGATNRPDLLDPALLRPGRFDRLVYVGIPEDKDSKLSVLKALTRKLKLADDVNLADIIECCPSNLSGADFYSLCSEAMMNRIQKNVESIESGNTVLEKADIQIHKDDFMAAMKNLVPSVSERDLDRFKKLKNTL